MSNNHDKSATKILIDGIFFQISQSGIARVWTSLLTCWATTEFSQHILVLDRAGTVPKIAGISYRTIPAYDYARTDADRHMVQQLCNEEKASLFVSTYYTTPISTPSVFLAYDMIPELLGRGLDNPMWREKHRAIQHASAYLAISKNTAQDLVRFFPQLSNTAITVAYCGVEEHFVPVQPEIIEQFRAKYQITKPYFLLVGDRVGWQGYKNTLLFFKALSLLENRHQFAIVCVGGQPNLEPELQVYATDNQVHLLRLTDAELKSAYSGALALVYPSRYEGFGLPVLEAMACGCPVITCHTGSIPEVSGEAALYVNPDNVENLVKVLQQVQQPTMRESLIQAGLVRAKQFSWTKMADIVSDTLSTVIQQQYDKPNKLPSEAIVIVTSLSTQRSLERQQQAMASWRQLGFTLVSLNTPDDIEKLQSSFDGVSFHPVRRDARADTDGLPLVYFDDLFAYLREQGGYICGITHPDVCLHTDNQFLDFVRQQTNHAMIFGSSLLDIDLSNPQVALVAYSWGIDVCFFNKDWLNQFPSSDFCLGIPWSDHWLLFFALNQNILVKYFPTPTAYFIKQHADYSANTWYRYGIYFVEYFALTNNVEYLHKLYNENPEQLKPELHQITQQVVQTIYQRSHSVNSGVQATAHTTSTQEQSVSAELQQQRQLRYQVAQQWLKLVTEQLETAYTGDFGRTHQSLLNSVIKDQPMTTEELAFANTLRVQVAKGFNEPQAIQYLLAAMLYWRADELPLKYRETTVPFWFVEGYLKFVFATPRIFRELGEVDNYYNFFKGFINYFHTFVFQSAIDDEFLKKIALFISDNTNCIPLYFASVDNLKDIYQKRAEIIVLTLKKFGFETNYKFAIRSKDRRKIRLGILKDHFSPQTETFALLPVFEHLNRNQFEMILYAIRTTDHPLEQYCRSRVDTFVKLSDNLLDQVNTLRNHDLDILFFGTNLTAVTNPSVLLATHRLARVQVTSIASPTTTGMQTMDYYIAGDLSLPPKNAQEHYQEKLFSIPGSGLCFSFPLPEETSKIQPQKAGEGVIFISGANFFKITPELRETWAKILVAVPEAILILYPFNPNWTNNYPQEIFVNQMQAVLAKYNIDSSRLSVLNALPTVADIRECLKVADIYLDSFPYGGATSLLDPLTVGLPIVAWQGKALRFCQAPALLRELKLSDLIVKTEEDYIRLAVNLAKRPDLRHQKRQQILQQMQSNPPFLDSRGFAKKIEVALQRMVRGTKK